MRDILKDIATALISIVLLVPVCLLACFHAAMDLPVRVSELIDEHID
tara:strand:+ start:23536 stop:23676 length:141 start_codon:yes stop_codon:yes gene_type:complete